MNLPNKLTCLRMLMVPFFVAAMVLSFSNHYLWALILFVTASFTDMLDENCPQTGPDYGFR